MIIHYRSSILTRIERAELESKKRNREPVLIIDMNKDGRYGEQGFTNEELDQYVKEKGYEVVIIDDILHTG